MIRCPNCGKDTGLWETVEVEGWRGLDAEGTVSGERDIDWSTAKPNGELGCSECEWRGRRSDVTAVGVDGEPLPEIHPDQETLPL